MEPVNATLRRGIPWVLVPLGGSLVLRLVLEPGYSTPTYFGLIALLVVYALVLRWLCRDAAPWRVRAVLLVNFVAINVGYETIGIAMNSHGGWRADAFVYGIDRALFGGDPQRFLTTLYAPWLSTAVMLGYLGFAGYLLLLFLSEAFVITPATGSLQLGLMRLYGIGFSGYVLLPAAGPAFHHPNLLPAIAHSSFSRALQPWVLSNCSHVDVCPSIHAAVCAFTLVWVFRRYRWMGWILVLPSAALLLGTVYLQYHYFIDLPFGLLLGATCAATLYHVKSPPVHEPIGAAG